MTNCYAYCRVSSAGQADEGRDGFPRQEAAIRAYATKNNLHIVQWFREAASGAKLEDRVLYADMVEQLKTGLVKTVVIERLDRFSRKLMDQENMLAEFRKHGITLISTMEPDLGEDDPARVLMRHIFGAIAQYDRAMIVAKLKAARLRARATRAKVEGRKHIGELPEDVATVRLIVELRSKSWTLTAIAGELDARQIKPPFAQRWHASTVRNVLKRWDGGQRVPDGPPSSPNAQQLPSL